jgi:catechol 2,3-dioxygenase-like lactoylglutathione lyase family enzyme
MCLQIAPAQRLSPSKSRLNNLHRGATVPERRQVLLFLAAASCATLAAGNNAEVSAPMEKVLGIGGFFFRSADPKALAAWYNDHLGVAPIPADYHAQPWQQEAGPTAFAPFPRDTKYFGADTQMFMLNFRVRDLAKMAAQLSAKGIAVKIDPESYPNGRFAHLHDPDGNPIELWQPK